MQLHPATSSCNKEEGMSTHSVAYSHVWKAKDTGKHGIYPVISLPFMFTASVEGSLMTTVVLQILSILKLPLDIVKPLLEDTRPSPNINEMMTLC